MTESSPAKTHIAKWWHRLGDGRIQCDLCPRGCKLKEGQRGFCFIRKALADRIVLPSYGRASGFCIDPIEKKPLYHFYPGSSVLSFGTAGCNLGCRYCQNWDISHADRADRLTEQASPGAIAEAALEAGCRSIAFTYNEPVIFAEYAIDTAIEAHRRGIKTVAVSSGYISREARSDFFSQMDAANIDLKSFTPHFYNTLCYGMLEPVLDNLVWLVHETSTWIEVTTLLIPGHNDSAEEIDQLCRWFVRELNPEVPLHFTAFHPAFKMLQIAQTPLHTLKRARNQALDAGLKHVYTGNAHDPTGQSTYCTRCGLQLIERNGYRIRNWRLLKTGTCSGCDTRLAGEFAYNPDRWRSRRSQLFIR